MSTREALILVEEWLSEAYEDGDATRLQNLKRIKHILLSEN